MNRITGFTDPDFTMDQNYHVTPEQAYSRERLAWQAQQRSASREVSARILLGIAAVCFGLLLAAVVVMAVT